MKKKPAIVPPPHSSDPHASRMQLAPYPDEIKAHRLKAGLSQREAAELILCAQRTWQDWEYGDRAMHPAFWLLFKMQTARVA